MFGILYCYFCGSQTHSDLSILGGKDVTWHHSVWFWQKSYLIYHFHGRNILTSGKYLHKQLLGFRIFIISLLQWKIAYVGVVTLRSRDGVAVENKRQNIMYDRDDIFCWKWNPLVSIFNPTFLFKPQCQEAKYMGLWRLAIEANVANTRRTWAWLVQFYVLMVWVRPYFQDVVRCLKHYLYFPPNSWQFTMTESA